MATSPATAALAQPPSLRTVIRRLLPSFFINGVLVYLTYTVLKNHTSASELVALLASSLPALLGEILTISRQRQLDVLGIVVLAAIAVTAVVSAVGGDPKIVLIRESFVTAVLGAACLISVLVPLLVPRPLLFYIIRYFATGNDAAPAAAFNSRWRRPAFRRYMRIITLVWGLVYLGEFPVRLYLVHTLSIQQYLAVGPVVTCSVLLGLITFTLAYGRRVALRR